MAFKRDSITSKTFEERGGSLEEAGETFFRQFLPPPSKELYGALKLLFGVHSGLELARDAEGKHIVGVKGDFFAGLGVAALAVLLGEGFELAETAQQHFLLFLEGFLHDSEHGIQHFFSVLLLHLGLGANRLGDICFGDGFAHGFFSGISLC